MSKNMFYHNLKDFDEPEEEKQSLIMQRLDSESKISVKPTFIEDLNMEGTDISYQKTYQDVIHNLNEPSKISSDNLMQNFVPSVQFRINQNN